MVFKKIDDLKLARRLNRIKRLFPSYSCLRFEKHVKHFKPDAVLCTHYSPLEALGEMRTKRDAKHGEPKTSGPLIVSVITDFEAHALWMNSSVDLYCVAT